MDAATLSITSVINQLGDGTFVQSRPKTPRSRHQVALLPSSCLVLRAVRESQEAESSLRELEITRDSLVFSHPDSRPIRPDSVTQTSRRIASKAGLRGVRLHALRHTYATLLMKLNVNSKVVSEHLGHSSTRLTTGTYSHMLPGLQASAVAGLEGTLASKVAISPAVSRLLARLINKGPGKIPRTLSVPRSRVLGGIRTHDLCLRRAALGS